MIDGIGTLGLFGSFDWGWETDRKRRRVIVWASGDCTRHRNLSLRPRSARSPPPVDSNARPGDEPRLRRG